MAKIMPFRSLKGPPVGATGFEFYSGSIVDPLEENTLFSDLSTACQTFHKMFISNPKIHGTLTAIINPLLRKNLWSISRYSDTPRDREIGEKVEKWLFHNDNFTWDEHIFVACLMIVYGFMVTELVFDEIDGLDQPLTDIAPRMPHTIQKWGFEKGKLKTIKQQVQNPDGNFGYPTILADKCAIFTRYKIGENYQGLSGMRPLWFMWKAITHNLTAIQVANQKTSTGVVVGRIPRGALYDPETTTFIEGLENYGNGEKVWMIEIGDDYTVRIEKAAETATVLIESLRLMLEEVPKCLLAQHIDLGTSSSGSRGVGDMMIQQLLSSNQVYGDHIANIHNKSTIRKIGALNWPIPKEELPMMEVKELNAMFDLTARAEILAKLIPIGAIPIYDDLQKRTLEEMGYPIPDFDELRAIQAAKDKQAREAIAIDSGKPKKPNKEAMSESTTGPYWREMRPCEKYVALSEIEQILDKSEQMFAQIVSPALVEYFDRVVKSAKSAYPDLEQVKLDPPTSIKSDATKILRELLETGYDQIYQEKRRAMFEVSNQMADPPPFALESRSGAMVWLKSSVEYLLDLISGRVEGLVNMQFLEGSKRGSTAEQVVEALKVQLEEIEIINQADFRFSSSSAMDMGRHLGMGEVVDQLKRIEYSALLDACPVCQKSDGEIMTYGSEEYYQLMPPNPKCKSNRSRSNRCRCMYVGVYKEEEEPNI